MSRTINLGNVTGTLQQEIENQKFRDVYKKVNLTFTSGGYYRQEKKFTEAYVEDAFVNAIIDCCKKWCIPYLDLYHDCGLVNALPDINQMYFSDDQTHPNEKAYRERLSDLVEIFMNSI